MKILKCLTAALVAALLMFLVLAMEAEAKRNRVERPCPNPREIFTTTDATLGRIQSFYRCSDGSVVSTDAVYENVPPSDPYSQDFEVEK